MDAHATNAAIHPPPPPPPNVVTLFWRSRASATTVLRIRDVYPGSRILIFTHPGSKNRNKREG